MSSIAASTPSTITIVIATHVLSRSLSFGVDVDVVSLTPSPETLLHMKEALSKALTNGKSQATFSDIDPCTYELCIGNHTVH